ncbi:hypothetical protein AOQ84DRAFT_370538 [Glonium stellatum]|uniref:NADAR domain-containing protein n=1 Tax=Glonium stellatum TaxID=574774 RepID=A0A8E2JZZ7_9PEZI|nr:hypothetical protein AOQ84DRAFT_370538 [Glonium stellatum]
MLTGTTLTFNCAEQLMMFGKALQFSDAATSARIMASRDPKEQKKLGGSNARLKEVLLATGERELCEASRRDRVWGIGYRADEAERYRRSWGENLLGKCLTQVREKLRREEDGDEYENVVQAGVEAAMGEGVKVEAVE